MGGVFTDLASVHTWIRETVAVGTPPVLSSDQVSRALCDSRIVDANGRGPRDPGYLPTWSGHYAAALLLETKADMLALAPGAVMSFTSEGSTVTRAAGPTADSLRAIAARHRALAFPGAGTVSVIDLGPRASLAPRSAFEGVTPDVDPW